jgi:hypothetical protein
MYEVGQKLWFEPEDRRSAPYPITITKVGRLWLHTGFGTKISVETLRSAERPQGRAWPSKADWLTYQEVRDAWQALRVRMDLAYQLPDGLTLEAVQKATGLLFPQSPANTDGGAK